MFLFAFCFLFFLFPLYFRWTRATSLKYCMAGKAPAEALAPHMERCLGMLHDDDLDVKKAALLMVNAAVHHQVINKIIGVYGTVNNMLHGTWSSVFAQKIIKNKYDIEMVRFLF